MTALTHDGTTIECRLTLRDDDGDILSEHPVSFLLRKLTPEAFLAALAQIVTAREAIREKLCPSPEGATP